MTYHLLCYHDDRLDGELAVAVVEQVFQAGTEEINHEYVVKTLLAEVVYIRNAGYVRVRRCCNMELGVDMSMSEMSREWVVEAGIALGMRRQE